MCGGGRTAQRRLIRQYLEPVAKSVLSPLKLTVRGVPSRGVRTKPLLGTLSQEFKPSADLLDQGVPGLELAFAQDASSIQSLCFSGEALEDRDQLEVDVAKS